MPATRRTATAGQGMLGTEGSLDTQAFFSSKRAAAVLKHAILSGYVTPFASKTGSASKGNRVVVVDGYAGAGRYDTGEPGSPALIAAAARQLRGRRLECLFVEKDRRTYERLCEVLREEENAGQVRWDAWHGTVEVHLAGLLRRAEGLPLFLFLDPFGAGLPFDVIVDVFAGRPAGRFSQATEVLFRFDANVIRRTRGALHAADYPGRAKTLERLDRAAGGTWWRDEDDPTLDNRHYLDWFMQRVLKSLCARAQCTGWLAAIREREGLQPAYFMVFLTRHRDGMEVFAEALSSAQDKWRRAVFDEAFAAAHSEGQFMLLDADEVFADAEELFTAQLHDRLERNVRSILRDQERFIVRHRTEAVFDGALGVAREKHLRVALKRLHTASVTSSDSKGDLYGKTVVRAPGAQP